jgi:aminoglycoside 6'-N-acetyltransferase
MKMMNLRSVIAADLALLRHWNEQPRVIAASPNDDWGWKVELNRSPDWREQLIAELDGRPIGFVQIIDPAREESHYWGDSPGGLHAIDIWIGEADELGKGYGTKMMKLALVRCFSDPSVTAVLIDPLANNVRAHRFRNDWVFISLNAAVSVTTTVWFTALTAAIGITRTLIEPRGR